MRELADKLLGNKYVAILVQMIKALFSRKLTLYAAAGAYYSVLSLIPAAIIICYVLPFTPITQQRIIELLDSLLPDSIAALVAEAIYNGKRSSLSLSIVVTVVSSSQLTAWLIRGIRAAYGVGSYETAAVFRVKAILYNLLFLILLPAALTPATVAVVPAIIYRISVGSGKRLIPGSIFTSLGWILFSKLFVLYTSYTDYYSPYGILGTLTIALLWVFGMVFVLLAGAVINSELPEEKQENDEPPVS